MIVQKYIVICDFFGCYTNRILLFIRRVTYIVKSLFNYFHLYLFIYYFRILYSNYLVALMSILKLLHIIVME